MFIFYQFNFHYHCCLWQAGKPNDLLLLSLEPEAASIFCQYLPTDKLSGAESGFKMSEVGQKYMIVDLGGTYSVLRAKYPLNWNSFKTV